MATPDHRLIELLVCPICKGKLTLLRDEQQRDEQQRGTALACHADRLAFPIRDGIPMMVENEAQPYDTEAHG
jgi:uncharacterized protein